MKKLLTCFFALVVVAPAAIAADGAERLSAEYAPLLARGGRRESGGCG